MPVVVVSLTESYHHLHYLLCTAIVVSVTTTVSVIRPPGDYTISCALESRVRKKWVVITKIIKLKKNKRQIGGEGKQSECFYMRYSGLRRKGYAGGLKFFSQ